MRLRADPRETSFDGCSGPFRSLGAVGEPLARVPTRDDWFDGALLEEGAPLGEYVVEGPEVLAELRDAILSLVRDAATS